MTATDEEVEDAARFAEIHDRILTFPKSTALWLARLCVSRRNNILKITITSLSVLDLCAQFCVVVIQ